MSDAERPRILAVDAAMPDPAVIAEAAATILHGGLVAMPTETVYGLAGNALEAASIALERISDSVEAIQEMGVLVKDLDIGLCDFPFLYDGRVVQIGLVEIRLIPGGAPFPDIAAHVKKT